MIEAPQPMSCRRGAEVLGASHHSIWRWRMAIIGALKPEPDDSLAGIVEADEAYQRESRKGSRGVCGTGATLRTTLRRRV